MRCTHSFSYRFEFESKTTFFDFSVDAQSLELIVDEDLERPEWTSLDHNKCKDCPLNSKEVSHCPMALATLKPIHLFNEHFSTEQVKVEVQTPERNYFNRCDLQTGLSALLGLLMATSGCPFFDFLKPLARFHSPFSSLEETHYRILSLFLMREHFAPGKKQSKASLKEHMFEPYEKLSSINYDFLKRMRGVIQKDSALNAVVMLDSLSQVVLMSLESGIDDLEYLFKP
jgi:hypothetical protein